MEPREEIVDIFGYAMQYSRVESMLQERLKYDGQAIEIDGLRYVLSSYRRRVLIAMGKAAEPMLTAFLLAVGEASSTFEGVISAPYPVDAPSDRFIAFNAGHPSPNQASIDGARAILDLLTGLDRQDLVIFLVSGGASSLVELSLDPQTSLELIAATYKALVECGAPITAINAVRKHLSAVKGGRLAAAASPAEQLTIAVSDVPAGRLDALSSGPTLPDESTLADVAEAVERYGLRDRLPSATVAQLEPGVVQETPKRGDAIFARSQWTVLLDSSSLETAARRRAEELGWTVVIDNTCDDWSAEAAAEYLLDRLRHLRREHNRVCLLSAGEVTVTVPKGTTGAGGRNQHFVLEVASRVAGEAITVLSGGSDGIDGNSPAAGGVADGTTVARARETGYSVRQASESFDSYTLLTQLGDAIVTGPTGNNLRDLRILLAY
jgi:glycerate 2-kinase